MKRLCTLLITFHGILNDSCKFFNISILSVLLIFFKFFNRKFLLTSHKSFVFNITYRIEQQLSSHLAIEIKARICKSEVRGTPPMNGPDASYFLGKAPKLIDFSANVQTFKLVVYWMVGFSMILVRASSKKCSSITVTSFRKTFELFNRTYFSERPGVFSNRANRLCWRVSNFAIHEGVSLPSFLLQWDNFFRLTTPYDWKLSEAGLV